MEEETSVEVEETTEESLPETNAEESEALEETTQESNTSSEETETTAKEEAEKPKSRASERIRELIAQKKALEARVQKREIEGVDETGIDPTRFAQSVEERAGQSAAETAKAEIEYYRAEQDFPLVKDNTMVRSRAAVLVDDGYSPYQAAEIASLEWTESTGGNKRQKASASMRQSTQIPSAGKTNVKTSDTFTRSEIANMSPQEYVKNQKAIQDQLEKFGPESFE